MTALFAQGSPLRSIPKRDGRKKKKKYTNSDIIIREECRGVAIMYDDKDWGSEESEKGMGRKAFRAGKVEPR